MSNFLAFTISPPRAGKSSYSRLWERYQDPQTLTGKFPKDTPRIVVNGDSLRLALHGCRYNGIMERLVHPLLDIITDKYLGMEYSVLRDECHTSLNSIQKILAIREDATPIYIKASLEQCYERAYASGQPDLVELGVIDRMFRNLRKVWNTYSLGVDGTEYRKDFEDATPEDFEFVVDQIRKAGITKHTNRIVTV